MTTPPELDDTRAPGDPTPADTAEAMATTAGADTLGVDPGSLLDVAALQGARASAHAKLFGQPPEPIRIGRFVILHLLGGGGMGVVYAAYDPELDRKVALKLLHPGGSPHTQLQERLVREAKAMAKISHPNVVTVHEVGTYEGQVFVAMEYIDGQTLSSWLSSQERSWVEIRDAFLAIGQGLAAAHRVGVVHRDFKPDNVMVTGGDESPRVIVLDFGLAVHAPTQNDERPVPDPDPRISLSDRLTRTGALLGTPAYMAPEQHRAAALVDARADQFSFGVSLFEAVYGRRPFPAETYAELAHRVCHGEIELPEQRGDMPLRAYRAMLRTLEVDPGGRFAQMDAVLAELGHDTSVARRRWLQVAGLGVVLAAAAFTVTRLDDNPACKQARQQLRRAWSDPTRTRAQKAFAATDRPYAAAAWNTVRSEVDGYVQRWDEAHEQVCTGTGSMTESDRIGRVVCLQWRAQELEAATGLLTQADAEVVERSVEVLSGLTPPEACLTEQALRAIARLPDDPSLRADVLQRRAALAHTQSLAEAGKWSEALRVAQQVREDPLVARVPALTAYAALRVGQLHRGTGDLVTAQRELADAAYAAIGSDRDDLAMAAASELVWLIGTDRADFDRAMPWMRLGEALQRRGTNLHDDADLELAVGSMFATAGRHTEALDVFERAVAQQRANGRPEDLVDPLLWLADALADVGRFDDADERLEEALSVARELRGDDHPDVARVLVRRGELALAFGRHVQAQDAFEAARTIESRARGEQHPAMAPALTGLAHVAWARGQAGRALELTERVLELVRIDRANATPVEALVIQAWIHVEQDQPLRAEESIDEALAVARRHGAEHPLLAMPLVVRAEMHRRNGRAAEALRYLERARELLSSSLGPADPRRHTLSVLVGLALREDGQLRRAVDVLSRARQELMSCCSGHHRLPEAELGLATTLERLEESEQRVASLRESARARLAALGRIVPPSP